MSRKKSKVFTLSDKEFKQIVNDSYCIRDVVKRIGYTPTSGSMAIKVKERIKRQNIDTSHFNPYNRKNTYTHELKDILVENSSYANRTSLKTRLLNAGLLKYECAICGNKGEWNGKPLSLQLHHINGIYNDNRLENIQLVCPNCHSQTESYSGKNAKNLLLTTSKD